MDTIIGLILIVALILINIFLIICKNPDEFIEWNNKRRKR
jgi:hypothetical protein